MLNLWRRYEAIIKTPAFIITATTGLFTLVSVLLSLFGITPIIPRVFALLAVAIGGLTIAIEAVRGILRRQVNVDELVTIAIVASVIYGEYLSAAFVAFMMLFGKILEDFTSERAKKAIEDLGKLSPVMACVRRDGKDIEVPIREVVPGDVVVVKSGERIPVDGVVISGRASVNQAPITGESVPVAKVPGSEIYAGSLNELGALEIKTTKIGDDTFLGQVKHLIKEAEGNRAPIVRTADRYARYFTPLILIIAAVVYLITREPRSALTVLIVACPCALVMATPTAIIAGIANGARRGILIKGGTRLELAGNITAVALDKTGTITLGEPQVVKLVPLNGASEKEVLETAAIAEKLSEHPLGRAIVKKAKEQGFNVPDADEFHVIPGQGVIARRNGRTIVVGTRELLTDNGVNTPVTTSSLVSQMESEGLTILPVAANGHLVGLIGMADIVRDEVRKTVAQLQNAGVKRVVMLTGDNTEVAKRIADSVGIGEWTARLLPQQKVEYIRKMQEEGYTVAMVGDGINDAPALVQADLGIAMGINGTDVAMDTADIVLMTGDALKAAEAINLSRKTLRVIKQNLIFALIFNLIGIGVAATGIINPIEAALYHNIGSVAVVVNSARLAGTKNISWKN